MAGTNQSKDTVVLGLTPEEAQMLYEVMDDAAGEMDHEPGRRAKAMRILEKLAEVVPIQGGRAVRPASLEEVTRRAAQLGAQVGLMEHEAYTALNLTWDGWYFEARTPGPGMLETLCQKALDALDRHEHKRRR